MFCIVIGRGVDYVWLALITWLFLIDLDDYLVSNPGKQHTIALNIKFVISSSSINRIG